VKRVLAILFAFASVADDAVPARVMQGLQRSLASLKNAKGKAILDHHRTYHARFIELIPASSRSSFARPLKETRDGTWSAEGVKFVFRHSTDIPTVGGKSVSGHRTLAWDGKRFYSYSLPEEKDDYDALGMISDESSMSIVPTTVGNFYRVTPLDKFFEGIGAAYLGTKQDPNLGTLHCLRGKDGDWDVECDLSEEHGFLATSLRFTAQSGGVTTVREYRANKMEWVKGVWLATDAEYVSRMFDAEGPLANQSYRLRLSDLMVNDAAFLFKIQIPSKVVLVDEKTKNRYRMDSQGRLVLEEEGGERQRR
jgi:hypothetical protein